MNIKHIILVCLSLAILSSCEDFFDSTTDVDIKPQEPRLVVFGYFNPDSTEQSVTVSKSRAYTQNFNAGDTVKNAVLKLYKNGTLIDDSPAMTQGLSVQKKYVFTQPLNASPSDEFKLEVSADDLESVYAVSSVPKQAVVTNIESKTEVYAVDQERKGLGVKTTLQDDPDVRNYYSLIVEQVDRTTGQPRQRMEITSNNPALETWRRREILFSDESFNGKTFNADIILHTLPSMNNLPPNTDLYITVTTMTEDLYRFMKTYKQYSEAAGDGGNPFAEPVTIHTNMKENGYGIFAFSQSKKYKVE